MTWDYTDEPPKHPNPDEQEAAEADYWDYITPIDRPDIAALSPQYQDNLLYFAQLVSKRIASLKRDPREDIYTAGVLSRVHLRHTAYDFIDIAYSTLDHYYVSRMVENEGLCRIHARVITDVTTVYDPWADQDEKDNNND